MTKGGYREGSGRKSFCEDVVPVHWRISESAKNWMKQKAVEDGVSIGAVLDRLIQHYEAVNSAVKVANNAIDIAQMCAGIEKKIVEKGLVDAINKPNTEYAYPDAQAEIEKLRICAQFRRPARINNQVVQIVNYRVGYDSFYQGIMIILFDTLPLDDYDEEYVLDIDVHKLR